MNACFFPAGQVQFDVNTAFAMSWLPSFALDPPTSKEVKDTWTENIESICLRLFELAGTADLIDTNNLGGIDGHRGEP